ncbi:CP2 transcription factor-domain-containing protein [Aspergillus carlsbadensis]|nr:CP2 transcription factor-domain-containing protein [Aspergillus carlsbadensis]
MDVTIPREGVDSRPRTEYFSNPQPGAHTVHDEISYTLQPSFTTAPDGAHRNPPMAMMDPHSPQYILSPNDLPGYQFPIFSGSSFAHAVGDQHAHAHLQNTTTTITTMFPWTPIQHPMAHNARNYNEGARPQPPAPRPASYPHQQQPSEGPEKPRQGPAAYIPTTPTDTTSQPTAATATATARSPSSRYRIVLKAPTAMAAGDGSVSPVTYLNRGQEYQLTITDTDPPPHPKDQLRVRYRTHVCITFDREDQRADPDAHWRLWKAARGLSAGGEREGQDNEQGNGPGSGSLHAIEYLDKLPAGALLNGSIKDQNVQLEAASFNGFCVRWSCSRSAPDLGTSAASRPALPLLPECMITVRFNFLTTDFCHYKGVKGFPVRLCARTEVVADDLGKSSAIPAREGKGKAAAEVCYCKVNLFRMYGAERKLTTDAAGVRKACEKVYREIDKRQPSPESSSGSQGGTGTSSGSTRSYRYQMRILAQLQEKLGALQAMLSSPRPVTVFSLRSDASDIPDLSTDGHSARYEYTGAFHGDHPSTASCEVCPDESSSSSSSMLGYPWETGQLLGSENLSPSDTQGGTPPDHAVTVPRNFVEDGKRRHIEVLDIDPYYKPTTQPQTKSVACFYIGFAGAGMTRMLVDYHVAVYLNERTANSLIEGVSMKLGIDPRRVWRVLLVRGDSVRIVDDSVVCGIPDGQDMLAEISEIWTFGGTSENPVEVKLRY